MTETTKDRVLQYNRNPQLTDWFSEKLTDLISFGYYHNEIDKLSENIIAYLRGYSKNHNINNVVVGISGGIDSALTATLFKQAGYNVTGILMPIHQKTDETDRGAEFCESLGINSLTIDLSKDYETTKLTLVAAGDQGLVDQGNIHAQRRQGNIRARLRMIALYNFANVANGLVASTDNFSELAAGFWTLHGDVGDVSPIQSLTKSWEVPAMADLLGVPQSIVEAVPTDGLGISNSDEDQLGCSYLEYDLCVLTLLSSGVVLDSLDEKTRGVFKTVIERLQHYAFKRDNPHYVRHPIFSDRLDLLTQLDQIL